MTSTRDLDDDDGLRVRRMTSAMFFSSMVKRALLFDEATARTWLMLVERIPQQAPQSPTRCVRQRQSVKDSVRAVRCTA